MKERLTEKNKRMFSELDFIISKFEVDLRNKIPHKLRTYISKSKHPDYVPKYNDELPFYEQKFSKKAMALLALIYIKYLCDTKEEQESMKKFLGEIENRR